jgi:hypothetical protein
MTPSYVLTAMLLCVGNEEMHVQEDQVISTNWKSGASQLRNQITDQLNQLSHKKPRGKYFSRLQDRK